MESMLSLGRKGITEIAQLQESAVNDAKDPVDQDAAQKLAGHFNNG